VGVIAMLSFQRKELALQRKELQVMKQELNNMVYTSNKTEQKFHEQTYNILLAAKLNALNTLIKLTQEKRFIHDAKVEIDEHVEAELSDVYLEKLADYANEIEKMLKPL
jgi:hypothetical protein